jgi:hypothetical protein
MKLSTFMVFIRDCCICRLISAIADETNQPHWTSVLCAACRCWCKSYWESIKNRWTGLWSWKFEIRQQPQMIRCMIYWKSIMRHLVRFWAIRNPPSNFLIIAGLIRVILFEPNDSTMTKNNHLMLSLKCLTAWRLKTTWFSLTQIMKRCLLSCQINQLCNRLNRNYQLLIGRL